MNIFYNVPLAKYTTFGIGGAARLFISVQSEEEIFNVVRVCGERDIPLRVLGAGSNVFVSDGGVGGVVLHIGRGFDKIEINGDTIRAQAGATLAAVAKAAEKAGLSGLEWAAHIPGSLGGAVFMNAGAYGSDMSAIVETVSVAACQGDTVPDPVAGQKHPVASRHPSNIEGNVSAEEYGAGYSPLDERGALQGGVFSNSQCGFGYRRSAFQDNGGVITGAVLKLKRGRAEDIKRLTREYLLKRKSSQPCGQRSAGSVFKKAADGRPAAELIDGLGLKGYMIGGAQISPVHANFIVNTGGAACADVLKLISLIKEKVYNAYGVMLETEIKII